MNEVSSTVKLLVDGVSINAPQGSNLLSVCLENGIYIPNLCFLDCEDCPAASCRLCFVKIEGIASPVAACTFIIQTSIEIKTNTDEVRRLQRSAMRMLLSIHDVDCKNCHANHSCELQKIAKFLKISLKPKPLPPIERDKEIDTTHPLIDHYPHRCVLCGKCIRVCRSQHSQPDFSFTGRGIDTVIRHYPESDKRKSLCIDCQSCINVCPVGALKKRETG